MFTSIEKPAIRALESMAELNETCVQLISEFKTLLPLLQEEATNNRRSNSSVVVPMMDYLDELERYWDKVEYSLSQDLREENNVIKAVQGEKAMKATRARFRELRIEGMHLRSCELRDSLVEAELGKWRNEVYTFVPSV